MCNKQSKFKSVCKKIAGVCKIIFGYGIMITLFLGGLSFIGYLVALIIGGEGATVICDFIYKKFFPVIIYATSCLVLFGLLAMYLAGEKSLTPSKRKPQNKPDQPNAENAQNSQQK